MRPKRIILVKHGESVGNVDKTILQRIPDYALQLTENGHLQAFKTGQAIKSLIGDSSSIQFYISPYWRTRQTYQEILKSFPNSVKEFYEDPRLREQEWSGSLQTQNYDQLEESRDNYGHFYYRLPNGESCADVFDRISDMCNTIHRDFEKPNFPENAIIVTHGMTMRLFLMRWYHYSVETFEKLANPKNAEFWIMNLNNMTGKYDLVTTPRTYSEYNHSYQYKW